MTNRLAHFGKVHGKNHVGCCPPANLTANVFDTFARDGKHCAFHGMSNRRISCFVSGNQRAFDFARVGEGIPLQLFGKAAEQLRQNYAGIASCAQKHSFGQLFQVVAQMLVRFGMAYAVFQRLAHVVARVTVGNGKHVHIVYFALVKGYVCKPSANHFFK